MVLVRNFIFLIYLYVLRIYLYVRDESISFSLTLIILIKIIKQFIYMSKKIDIIYYYSKIVYCFRYLARDIYICIDRHTHTHTCMILNVKY